MSPLVFTRADITDALTLATTELQTFLRHLRSDPRQLLARVLSVGWFALWLPLMLYGRTTALGRALAGGTVPLGTAGAGVGAVLGVGGYLGFAGGFNQSRVGTVGPLVQTSIPPIAVSMGRFLTRLVQALFLVVPVGLLFLIEVGIGAGGVVVPVAVGLALVPPFAAGLLWGRVVGDCVRYLNERVQVSLWIRAGVLVVAVSLFAVGIRAITDRQFSTGGGEGVSSAGPLLPGEPLQAYAGVVFVPFGGTQTLLGIVTGGLCLIAVPVAFVTAMWLETYMLTHDIGRDSETATRVETSQAVPRLFEQTASMRVAWRYLLRTRRDPRLLVHLAPVFLIFLSMGGSVIFSPDALLAVVPPAVVIMGGIIAGGAYCLNPLGDERNQLPLLFTSTHSTTVLLRGRMIAGCVLGLTVAVGVGTPLGLFQYGPGFVLGQTVFALLFAVSSGSVALGVGAVAPKFETEEFMSVERATPSQIALLFFLFGGIVVGTGGFALLWLTIQNGFGATAIGWLIYLFVTLLPGVGGYRYAVGRMNSLTLDDL